MIDIIKSNIFDSNKIIAGVTKINKTEEFPLGFSITPALIYDEKQIANFRKTLCENLNLKKENFIIQKQIHSDIIRIVGINSQIEESDAMICSEKGVVLNVSIADCAAILIHCPDIDTVAGIHSGWQGTSLNITGKTIRYLIENFQAEAKLIKAYISPCASGEMYEVEWDVAKLFPFHTKQISDTKYLFDNKSQIIEQLLEKGVPLENIECSEICTISDTNYHSYRRDKNQSGRMSAFIGMI